MGRKSGVSNHDGTDAFLPTSNYAAGQGNLRTGVPFWRTLSTTRRRILMVCASLALLLYYFRDDLQVETAAPIFADDDLRKYGKVVRIAPGWPGFSNIEQWFPFGDSYTDTSYNHFGVVPGRHNPLGNPTIPDVDPSGGIGTTYVGHLAARYEHSPNLKVFNMGLRGGTIDDSVTPSYMTGVDYTAMLGRFYMLYCSNVTGHPRPTSWKPQTTLFSVFYGINDMLRFNKTEPRWKERTRSYDRSLDDLYDTGGRNFMIINVPPMDQSPPARLPIYDHNVTAETVQMMNDRIAGSIKRFSRKHKDATVFSIDFYSLFRQIARAPSTFPQTQIYKNTTGMCWEYEFMETTSVATPQQIEKCGGLKPIEYLWHDVIHLTSPAHDVLAAVMSQLLNSADSKK